MDLLNLGGGGVPIIIINQKIHYNLGKYIISSTYINNDNIILENLFCFIILINC